MVWLTRGRKVRIVQRNFPASEIYRRRDPLRECDGYSSGRFRSKTYARNVLPQRGVLSSGEQVPVASVPHTRRVPTPGTRAKARVCLGFAKFNHFVLLMGGFFGFLRRFFCRELRE